MRIDLGGMALCPSTIAIIVTAIERDGCVEVVNAQPVEAQGKAAMTLGMMLVKAAHNNS